MPWIKVWLHFVWSTKDRYPYLRDEIRVAVFEHIRENARLKGIHIDFIGGYVDHVHCLSSLQGDQSIENLMQLIKGESSFWINRKKLTRMRFAWQDEYFVVSVNPDSVERVRRYIAKQEEHHSKVAYDDEFENFLLRAGFVRVKDSAG
jgi:putative transposase